MVNVISAFHFAFRVLLSFVRRRVTPPFPLEVRRALLWSIQWEQK